MPDYKILLAVNVHYDDEDPGTLKEAIDFVQTMDFAEIGKNAHVVGGEILPPPVSPDVKRYRVWMAIDKEFSAEGPKNRIEDALDEVCELDPKTRSTESEIRKVEQI